MPAHITVYCQNSVATVTADNIIARLKEADLLTLAERFGFEDEDEIVEGAIKFLRIEPVFNKQFASFTLHYRPPDQRQIQVNYLSDELNVIETIKETIENGDFLEASENIKNYLTQTTEIVDIELGWQQLEDIGVVLAFAIAQFFAERGRGVIKTADDEWLVGDD